MQTKYNKIAFYWILWYYTISERIIGLLLSTFNIYIIQTQMQSLYIRIFNIPCFPVWDTLSDRSVQ